MEERINRSVSAGAPLARPLSETESTISRINDLLSSLRERNSGLIRLRERVFSQDSEKCGAAQSVQKDSAITLTESLRRIEASLEHELNTFGTTLNQIEQYI